MGSPLSGRVAYFYALNRNEGFFFHLSLITLRWGHPSGQVWSFFPLDRYEVFFG